MKLSYFVLLTLLVSVETHASPKVCDIRLGRSAGVRVVEFATDNVIHSKMSIKDTTADALIEEMINLQDEGLCEEKILSKTCVLKFEKVKTTNLVTMYRGREKWLTWLLSSKTKAEDFIKNLKRVGFCS